MMKITRRGLMFLIVLGSMAQVAYAQEVTFPLPIFPFPETFALPDGFDAESGWIQYTGVEAISLAINDDFAWISAYRAGEFKQGTFWLPMSLSGEIIQVDLQSGETTLLISGGFDIWGGQADPASPGWGLHYDDNRDELIACGNLGTDFGTLQGVVRVLEPTTGEIVTQFDTPAGVRCHALVTDSAGNIYIGDTNIGGDIVKIDRATGESAVWLDVPLSDPDNSNGLDFLFGRVWLGAISALTWDGENNFYVSANDILYRVPINTDGSAGTPVAQTVADTAGNVLPFGRFYGLSTAENSVMYGTRYDFDTEESQLVELLIADEDALIGSVVYTDAVAMTGIAYDAGTLYGADSQLPPPSFGLGDGSWATTPYSIHAFEPPTPATEPTAVTFTTSFANDVGDLALILLLFVAISMSVSTSMGRDG